MVSFCRRRTWRSICTVLVSVIIGVTLASDEVVHEQVYEVPAGDVLKTSESFPIGYGLGGGAGLGGLGLGGFGGGGGIGGGGGYYTGNLLKSFGGNSFGGGVAGGGALQQGSGYQAGGGQKAQSGAVSQGGYVGSEGAKRRGQQDSGFYGESAGGLNNYNKGGAYQGGTNRGQTGLTQGELKNAGAHRKGHSNKGFENFHHKDEVGQTSTFFDESSDEGDHFNYQGQEGKYGDHGGSAYKGALQDGRYSQDARGREGKYGQGYSADDRRGEKGSLGQQVFYGNEQDFGQKNAFNDYGKKSALQQQQYGGEQGQHYGNGYSQKGGYGGYGGYGIY